MTAWADRRSSTPMAAGAAAAVGLAWIVGRLWYYMGYSSAVEKRVPGFLVQALACLLLFIGAIAGVVIHMTRG